METKIELIKEALSTSNILTLKQLSQNQYMHVRRAVARNFYTTAEVLSTLAHDKVLNVSYMALQNPNCNVKRDIEIKRGLDHPCVCCVKTELEMQNICSSCKKPEKYLDNKV